MLISLHGGTKILDLLLTSAPEMIEELQSGCPIANSDHCVLEFDLIIDTNEELNQNKTFKYI